MKSNMVGLPKMPSVSHGKEQTKKKEKERMKMWTTDKWSTTEQHNYITVYIYAI